MKGTTKEAARAKYVELTLAVGFVIVSISYFNTHLLPKLLEKHESDSAEVSDKIKAINDTA